MGKLTDTAIRGALAPGKYGDGDGLWLLVSATGSKSWVFRYKIAGRERAMGLGPYPTVPLTKARTEAQRHTATRAAGKDPLELREQARKRQQVDAARAVPFRECAQTYIALHKASWKNAKHSQQWENTLETYVYPIMGDDPVSEVNEPRVLQVLQQEVPAKLRADGSEVKPGGPLWQVRLDTAQRVRGRIELILDWAKAHKHRDGDNPARWRGNLSFALPKRKKRSRRHHPALPYEQVPQFLTKLRERESISALALEFLIYNAPRTMETLAARGPEMDEAAALWTIPEERMKAEQEHCIPLAPQSLTILERAKKFRRADGYIFPGRKNGRPLSNSALLELVKPMGFTDHKGQRITVHGFRSTFRDWVAECTSFPEEVAEMALAHVIEDEVKAAYRRGALLEKRRALMEAWANYCNGATIANVVYIQGRAA